VTEHTARALTGQGRTDGILARAPRDGRHVEADLLCGTAPAAKQ
jgi:hypothetical protein